MLFIHHTLPPTSQPPSMLAQPNTYHHSPSPQRLHICASRNMATVFPSYPTSPFFQARVRLGGGKGGCVARGGTKMRRVRGERVCYKMKGSYGAVLIYCFEGFGKASFPYTHIHACLHVYNNNAHCTR